MPIAAADFSCMTVSASPRPPVCRNTVIRTGVTLLPSACVAATLPEIPRTTVKVRVKPVVAVTYRSSLLMRTYISGKIPQIAGESTRIVVSSKERYPGLKPEVPMVSLQLCHAIATVPVT